MHYNTANQNDIMLGDNYTYNLLLKAMPLVNTDFQSVIIAFQITVVCRILFIIV